VESNNELTGNLPIPFAALDIIAAGRGEVGTAFNSFNKRFCHCVSLMSS